MPLDYRTEFQPQRIKEILARISLLEYRDERAPNTPRNSEYSRIKVYCCGGGPNLKYRDSRKLLAVVGDDTGGLVVPWFYRDACIPAQNF